MAGISTEEALCMQCEKIVNETWSIVDMYYDDLKRIILEGTPSCEHDELIVMIAANATLHKMTMDRAINNKVGLP